MKDKVVTNHFANEDPLEQCRSYLLRQSQASKRPSPNHTPTSGPAITISHQTGAGAHEIAQRLARLLQATDSTEAIPWTVFDRELLEQVLKEHHLPKTLARYMPEDRRSYIRDVMDELVGLRPPSWVMIPRIAETILHLVEKGQVILLGRGANFVTERMPNVYHVRLVASLRSRLMRVHHSQHLTPKAAMRLVKDTDRGRRRYVQEHFHKRIDDDLSYHLVINTDRIQSADAAWLIAEGARKFFQSDKVPQL